MSLLRSCAVAGLLVLVRVAVSAETGVWAAAEHCAPAGSVSPSLQPATWDAHDLVLLDSALSPGVLLRLKSASVTFFSGLSSWGAAPPAFLVVRTDAGPRVLDRGVTLAGEDMAAPWAVASFQGCRGWEQFDTPWFLALHRRPRRLTLTAGGLLIEYPDGDTGYVFSMPLYGYDKPPQERDDFCARHGLPHRGVRPWQWRERVPENVVRRCELWARISRAWPVAFRESFSVDAATDLIVFRQDHAWFLTEDDWGTTPLRFAPIPPALALARQTGFPMSSTERLDDVGMMTSFGPSVGAFDVDRVEYALRVLQYTHELEELPVPTDPTAEQERALGLIRKAMRSKFRDAWRFRYDHGDRGNFVWNIVGDVWYPKGIPFVDTEVAACAKSALRVYMANDVLRPFSPHRGKTIIHGPGIDSWGGWGDAGKFAANALQPIWAFGEYGDGWDLIRDRWPLIKRFFITPEEARWAMFGRGSIAELGDEAAPCSAYARMAWAVGDRDECLFGAYMFARELAVHWVKQFGGKYFYEHQPYQPERAAGDVIRPMPPRVYPTDCWGSTLGWQVDGPSFGRAYSREHQSANRWVRFHDPDVGRFYREHSLADRVREELEWYTDAAAAGVGGLYRPGSYTKWLKQDNAHILPSLARLRSFLLGESFADLERSAPLVNYEHLSGAGAIAAGYAFLRSTVTPGHRRLLPRDVGPSPFVLGLQRERDWEHVGTVQSVRVEGLSLLPGWHKWPMPKPREGRGDRVFGFVKGDFARKVAGPGGREWISYGCRLQWRDAVVPRTVEDVDAVLRAQERTPVMVGGPFSNANDTEITETAYPPERAFDPAASYAGAYGPLRWRAAETGLGRAVDLRAELSAGKWPMLNTLAYVQQFVHTSTAVRVWLHAGHHGGIQAWVNGERVLSENGHHLWAMEPDKSRAMAALKPGANRILLKVACYGSREFRTQFRITGLDGRPVAGLRFSAEP